MFETIMVLLFIVFFLFVVFLFTMDKKKQNRNIYYSRILSIYLYRFRNSLKHENALSTKALIKKNERINKLEDLIYGKGKRFSGIQLPPLDLTNAGIFSLK